MLPSGAAWKPLLALLALFGLLGLLLAGAPAVAGEPPREDRFERPAMANRVFGSDTKPPDATAGERLLAAICGAENVTGPAKKRHCGTVPDYPNGPCSDLDLTAATSGSFSRPGVREVFVSYDGCEAHVNNFGGGILLRREGSGWRRVLFLPAERGDACLRFRRTDGRDALVCLNLYVGQGEEDAALTLLTFDGDTPLRQERLTEGFTNQFLERSLCEAPRVGERLSFQILESWQKLPATAKTPPRLRLHVRHEEFSVPPLCAPQEKVADDTARLAALVAWRRRHARREDILLEWCGDRFAAPGAHCAPEPRPPGGVGAHLQPGATGFQAGTG
jgi:hypothetical protein